MLSSNRAAKGKKFIEPWKLSHFQSRHRILRQKITSPSLSSVPKQDLVS